MFSQAQLKVIEYCAEEVKRQGDTPTHVYHMLNAWEYANEYFAVHEHNLEMSFIQNLGTIVSPKANPKGFRTIPIGVNDPKVGWIEKAQPENIERLLGFLIEAYYAGRLDKRGTIVPESLHPLAKTAEDQFYFNFENIHPFRDGNGRTGKILYNYLCGTLERPIMPPNFWNSSNP